MSSKASRKTLPVSLTEKSPANERGFSIVELVIVIVLVAIVSAVGMSRIMSGNSFNEVIVRDQIISMARTSLQSSLGRADVELLIQPDAGGSTLTITSSDNSGVIDQATVSMDSVTLSGDINETDGCDTTNGADAITDAAPMTLAFGELGTLDDSGVTGSTGPVTSAVRICINNSPTFSVCVSPSGFAYAGSCDV